MAVTNLDPDVVNSTDAVLNQLVIDLNKGTDGTYRIVQTRTYTVRSTTDGWLTNTDDTFKVVRREKGVNRDIATLYIRDGSLSSVAVERGVDFHDVPQFLRRLSS